MLSSLITTAFVVTFGKYVTKCWFPYFMAALIFFEVCLFTLTRGKDKNRGEVPVKRREKATAEETDPAEPLGSRAPQSPKQEKKVTSKKNK